jgi:uncharacterized membrane protein YccC
MTATDESTGRRRQGWLARTLRAGAPAILFGLRLWASVCLALFVAFWLELDNPSWAATTAAIVCQPQLGASLRKASFRMLGTVVGAVAIVVLTACFPQNRVGFLLGLGLWCAACGFVATILRNFAAYAAALAGFTAVIIASDELGVDSGPSAQVFMLAVVRATEIVIGIVCAGVVLAGTDLGDARRRLAAQLASVRRGHPTRRRVARIPAQQSGRQCRWAGQRQNRMGHLVFADAAMLRNVGCGSPE